MSDFLTGVISKDKSDPLPERECANSKCHNIFHPRSDGDDYCSERCDPLNTLGSRRSMIQENLDR